MKRWLSVAAIVVLCLALVIGVACGEEEEEEEGVTELKFGIGVQLSGLFAPIVGIPVKRGYELEAERIGVFEVGGKEYRWKVIAEDNLGGSAEGGVASATKFIYEDDVDFMFQAGSGAAMGAQPLCEESGIIADMGTSEFEAFGPDKRYSIQAAPCTAAAIIPFYDWVAKEHPEVKHIVMALMDAPITGAYNEVLASDAHEYFGFESDIVWIPEGTTEYYPIATSVMALHPDLVIGYHDIFDALWELGYEGLSAPMTPLVFEALVEAWGWDDAKGLLTFFQQTYGAEEVWPEAAVFQSDYEARYGEEMGTVAFWAAMVLDMLTSLLQQAGTLDADEVVEAIQAQMTVDTMIGPIYFGGEAFVGVNVLSMWPVAILEVVGEREWAQVGYYTPEEAEAIAVEAWTATMK